MRGFSLLEVIISTIILTVLAAGIFATISFSKRMALRAQERTVASSIVEAKLNQLKAQGASKIAVTDSPSQPQLPEGCIENAECADVSQLRNGKLNTVIQLVPPDNSEREKEVLVLVNWKDPRGAAMTEAAATYLYDP